MNCLICGSKNIETRDTIVSDFVMSRIDKNFDRERDNKKTRLCFCKDCTFAFYEYRFSPKEELLLYKNYRDDEYQKQREKYECWYTKKVNDALNNSNVVKQQDIIKKVLYDNNYSEFSNALDYGGNQGATFYDKLGTVNKYVFDISGVQPIDGIINIKNVDDLYGKHFDFIMCNMVFEHLTDPYLVLNRLYDIGDDDTVYYIEVPSENPFIKGNKFSIRKNIKLLMNKNYNWFKLIKYYFQQKKQPFMPMKEHINYFTQQSLKEMAEKVGFAVIDVQENPIDNATVLSMIFKKQ